jgi:hypothetical protein
MKSIISKNEHTSYKGLQTLTLREKFQHFCHETNPDHLELNVTFMTEIKSLSLEPKGSKLLIQRNSTGHTLDKSNLHHFTSIH